MDDELFQAIVDLRENDVLRTVKDRVLGGQDPIEVAELCREAMAEAGDRFAKKEYFLSPLVLSAEIFRQIMEILEPKILERTKGERLRRRLDSQSAVSHRIAEGEMCAGP